MKFGDALGSTLCLVANYKPILYTECIQLFGVAIADTAARQNHVCTGIGWHHYGLLNSHYERFLETHIILTGSYQLKT